MDRIRVIERRDVDELILLDVSATPNGRVPQFDQIGQWCENLFCPVTVGGGVRNEDDIRALLRSGADKVVACTGAIEGPDLISRASRQFGAQAVVISIDVLNGRVTSHCGRTDTGLDPVAWARECEDRGAGEILLNSIERDGTLEGYDIDLVRDVSEAVSIPVVACGGCGDYSHLAEVLYGTKAHAVAVGAMFQFCEATPKGASRYLADRGFQVRI